MFSQSNPSEDLSEDPDGFIEVKCSDYIDQTKERQGGAQSRPPQAEAALFSEDCTCQTNTSQRSGDTTNSNSSSTMYCSDCDTVVCLRCTIECHREHMICSPAAVVDEKREELNRLTEAADHAVKCINKNYQDVEVILEQLKEHESHVVSEIEQRFDLFFSLLSARRATLLSTCASEVGRKRSILTSQLNRCSAIVSSIKKVSRAAKCALDSSLNDLNMIRLGRSTSEAVSRELRRLAEPGWDSFKEANLASSDVVIRNTTVPNESATLQFYDLDDSTAAVSDLIRKFGQVDGGASCPAKSTAIGVGLLEVWGGSDPSDNAFWVRVRDYEGFDRVENRNYRERRTDLASADTVAAWITWYPLSSGTLVRASFL
jgi:hypothetical protein